MGMGMGMGSGMGSQIILGDCLEVMDHLPRGSVDLLLTDPPYNILVNAANIVRDPRRSGSQFRGSDIVRTKHRWDSFPDEHNYVDFMRQWICKAVRLLKDDCNFVSFIAVENVSYLCEILSELGFRRRNHFAWVKTYPVPHLRKVNFAHGVELMMWFSRGRNTFNYELGHQPNYFISPTVTTPGGNRHPTQKPLKLMELLIKYLSREGDVVLDPFMGSGTTLVAAERLGRRYIGIERSEEYYEMARRRVRSVPVKLKRWF